MGVPYLGGHNWSRLTREERFHCFVLYSHVAADPGRLARFLSGRPGFEFDSSGEWDAGVEVCFYRDYLWHHNLPIRNSRYSPKRTFDLCLFGERDIIIEAKVCQAFDCDQGRVFESDAKLVPQLLERPDLRVLLVPLASDAYFTAAGDESEAMRPFGKRRFSWGDAHGLYDDPLLEQAEALFYSRDRLLVAPGEVSA